VLEKTKIKKFRDAGEETNSKRFGGWGGGKRRKKKR